MSKIPKEVLTVGDTKRRNSDLATPLFYLSPPPLLLSPSLPLPLSLPLSLALSLSLFVSLSISSVYLSSLLSFSEHIFGLFIFQSSLSMSVSPCRHVAAPLSLPLPYSSNSVSLIHFSPSPHHSIFNFST